MDEQEFGSVDMPTPNEGESEKDFVERCVPEVIEDGTAEDGTQAAAVCHSMWREHHSKGGNFLKAIGATDDTLTVANYIVLFDGRDLEGIASPRVNQDGSRGEFFSDSVDLESEYTKSGVLYVDWEHGRGKKADGPDAPGRHDVLGLVDWSTAQRDKNGVWVQRALNRRSEYVKFLEVLIKEGLIGTSSEPVEELVKVKSNGEIVKWPLKRDALTVQPMEPRMIGDNSLEALKALNEMFPNVESLAKAISAATEDGSRADSSKESETGTQDAEDEDSETVDISTATERPNVEVKNTMADKEEKGKGAEEVPEGELLETQAPIDYTALGTVFGDAVEAAVTKAVEAVDERWEERLKKARAANPSGAGWYLVEDEADRKAKANPYKSFGEFLKDVASAGQNFAEIPERLRPMRSDDPLDENGFDMAKAMGNNFVGSVIGASMRAKAPTGLQTAVPSDGGYFIGSDSAPGIMARVYQIGNVLQRVGMIGISANNNSLSIHAEDETSRADGYRRGGVRVYWVAEGGEMTSSRPKFRDVDLKLKKLAGLVYATDEMLADASALESYVLQMLPEEMRFVIEDTVFNGDGVGKPQGFMNSDALVTVAKETGQDASTIVAQNVMKMWARRWIGGRNYAWYVNQDCGPQLWQLQLPIGTGGVPLYQPPGGLSSAPYATLMGAPVYEVEYCQTVGTAGDIVLASLDQFQMIEKGGIETASSIHVRFVYGEQVFRFIYRCDGESLWNSDLTPKNGSNTVSPYVALASRS